MAGLTIIHALADVFWSRILRDLPGGVSSVRRGDFGKVLSHFPFSAKSGILFVLLVFGVLCGGLGISSARRIYWAIFLLWRSLTNSESWVGAQDLSSDVYVSK